MNRYAWILTSFCLTKARAWIETKEMGTRQWSLQEQLILAQGVDSKKGQLIYLTRRGSFQVILYKMSRFLSGKLKKHMKLAKIAFLLTNWSFLWTLTNLVIPWQYTLSFDQGVHKFYRSSLDLQIFRHVFMLYFACMSKHRPLPLRI